MNYTKLLTYVGLCVLVAIVALMFINFSSSKSGEENNREKKRGLITTVDPSLSQRNIDAESTTKGSVSATQDAPAEPEVKQMTPEEIEAEERRKDPLYDRHHIVAKMPLVKEPIEQLMLTVFTTELGDMPPMLPTIPAFDEERFEKLVNLTTLAEDGDTEEVLLSKDVVNEVKAELAKYLKEGGTINGFLAYYVNELDYAFRERNTCQELMMKSMKTDDPELAREVYNKFNERLTSKGIKPLTLTRRQREYLGIPEEE